MNELSRPGYRRRRWARVIGAATAAAGVLLVSLALPAGPAEAATGTTVAGPKVWQPVTDGDNPYGSGKYGAAGTISVDQTANLTNQVVHVSWTGFTPTNDGFGDIVPSVTWYQSFAMYAVRVYQCRGTDPKITDCYGSTQYGSDPAKGFDQPGPAAGLNQPEFPSNAALAVTRADGTGEADVEVWTSRESQTLGCDATHPCSLVVEPEYGGDSLGVDGSPPNCDDHSQDSPMTFTAEANDSVMQVSDAAHNLSGERCAWSHRTVIPLSFAQTPSDCKVADADFSAEGLPMFNRAAQQWIAGLCLAATNRLTVQYSGGLPEPQARADFLGGAGTDVAFTAQPASPTAGHVHPYVYAPMANSAIAVVFLVDDPLTGTQLRNMRLNARLLAKMLTQSYALSSSGAVASDAGNPQCIFADPEFKQLNGGDENGGANFPTCAVLGDGPAVMAPIVTGGQTDLVYQLTSWIAADPDARAFLQGDPDPWGMHIDQYYLPSAYAGYPTTSFIAQDSSGVAKPGANQNDPGVQAQEHLKQYEWNPIQAGLESVARNLLQNKPTCISTTFHADTGTFPKCASIPVGTRTLFGVLDAGQAAAYRMPTAALENPAGAFVQPTVSTMAHAVADMTTDKDTGTQSMPYGAGGTAFGTDAGAYPLTTVQYAMVPTAGAGTAKAGAISQYLRTVTASSGGQIYGASPGRLAPGYLTLTAGQQAQAATAATHVAAQDGAPPQSTQPGGGSGSGGNGAAGTSSPAAGTGTTPATGTTPVAGSRPSASATPSLVPQAVVGAANPDRAGAGRFVLPAVLIAGLVLVVGGPAGMLYFGTGLAGRLRRLAWWRR